MLLPSSLLKNGQPARGVAAAPGRRQGQLQQRLPALQPHVAVLVEAPGGVGGRPEGPSVLMRCSVSSPLCWNLSALFCRRSFVAGCFSFFWGAM